MHTSAIAITRTARQVTGSVPVAVTDGARSTAKPGASSAQLDRKPAGHEVGVATAPGPGAGARSAITPAARRAAPRGSEKASTRSSRVDHAATESAHAAANQTHTGGSLVGPRRPRTAVVTIPARRHAARTESSTSGSGSERFAVSGPTTSRTMAGTKRARPAATRVSSRPAPAASAAAGTEYATTGRMTSIAGTAAVSTPSP
ncbi:hypothetical protein N136_01981 [Leifsonia aquatica ATCC 14665]|uniref:Uncharacterized protein n=1 Tax=Leifsonia aquatica ATCC 14665 TaxID=1358026 RepID=U2T2E9_LEIAQ|nr:hypothetical protein N136_01981 [Leifsonia aquatica ATCC 14665]